MVSVQTSWPLTGVSKTSSIIGQSAWRQKGSSPPLYPRPPPDGHEFPPQYEDLAERVTRTTAYSHVLDKCHLNPVSVPASTGRRDCLRFRSRPIRPDGSERLDFDRLASRTMCSSVSVRDRIALFSSQSVEHLSSTPVSVTWQQHGPGSKQTLRRRSDYPIDRQQRSKSDLKLECVPGNRLFRQDVLMPSPYGGSLSNISFSNSPILKTFDQKSCQAPSVNNVRNKSQSSSGMGKASAPYLSERSQSLTQLGVSEKAATANSADISLGPGGLSQRKTSLNVINEERRIGSSRLKGLVIPKTALVPNRTPIDLPTIRSNCPKYDSSSHKFKGRSLSFECNSEDITERSSSTESKKALDSPSWRNNSTSMSTYSPAFKRKNIKLYSLSGSLSALPPNSNSPSPSKLGGSNVDISEHDKTAVGRLPSSTTREPLKRSSSLNCQGGVLKGRIYRKTSDNILTESGHNYSGCLDDMTSSTQTLVSEPPCRVNDRQTGSEQQCLPTENDWSSNLNRFSKSRLVSGRKSIDNSCLSSFRQSTITPNDTAKTDVEEKSNSNSTPTCPRILHDTAWMKTAQTSKSARLSETGDLLRLKRVKKPSVKLLTEKWQQLSDSSDGDKSSQTSPTAECEANFSDCSRLKDQSILSAQIQRTSLRSEVDGRVNGTDTRRNSQKMLRAVNYKLDEFSGFNRQESSRQSMRSQCFGESDDLTYSLNAYLSGMNDLCGQSPIDSDLADLSRLDHSPRSSTSSSSDNSTDSGGSSGGAGSSLLDLLTSNFRRSVVAPGSITATSSGNVGVNELQQDFDARHLYPENVTGHNIGHTRMSSVDSATSDDSIFGPSVNTSNGLMTSLAGVGNGSVNSLVSAANGSMSSLISGPKDHYGSISSLASSTSLISPHELQLLIDDANQSLEEAGTPSHEIIVAVLHREIFGGSIGITLAGGADYDNKEISVNKVLNGSVAERDGRIKPGDRILSINGKSMKGLSHMDALKTLKSPRTEVVFVVSRSRSVTPLDNSSGNDNVNGSFDCGSTYPRGCYINHVSQRPPKILESPSDLSNHNQDAQFVDVPRSPPMTITLTKGGASIGFSLQGGKDSPLGDRPLVAKKIFTGGAADKSGLLDVGDQILAINDQSVTNMARFEAWNFIKKQPDGPVRLKICKALSLKTSAEKTSNLTNVEQHNLS